MSELSDDQELLILLRSALGCSTCDDVLEVAHTLQTNYRAALAKIAMMEGKLQLVAAAVDRIEELVDSNFAKL